MWYTHVYPIRNQLLESGLRHPFIEGSPAAIARLSGAYLPCFLAWNDRSGPWLLHYQGDSFPPELILELGAQCTDCKTYIKKRDRASIRFISTSLRSVCEKPLLQYNGWKLGIQRCILSWYKSSMPDPPIEQMVGNRATDQHLPSLKWFNQLTIWSVTTFKIDPGQELVKSLFLWG